MLLNNTLGFIGYLFLPNDYVWSLLSATERDRVKVANHEHNNFRPDYADPAIYQGGQSFNSPDDRETTYRGKVIRQFLDRMQPKRVVEIGPGSGYYTRQIVEHPSVREYVALDINTAFLDYIRGCLSDFDKPGGLKCEFVGGDASVVDATVVGNADAVICLSSVHHIPDRDVALAAFARLLRSGGEILAIDPTHYIPRMTALARKCVKGSYLKRSFRDHPTNISTHHFCTLGEYRRICRNNPSLSEVESTFWVGNRPITRWRSNEMSICLRNQS